MPHATLSAGDKDQLSMQFQSIQYHGTSCLELSVSIYEKFRYHHHFQGSLKTELFFAAFDTV